MSSQLEFISISKAFGQKQVLREVSFQIQKGEIAFLLGKSGTGKSVSLKQIIGLMTPDSGQIKVQGRVGMVFQHPALFDSLTVEKNISFGLPDAMPVAQKKEVVKKTLSDVGLSVDWNALPESLSYGTQKRVSIARTLAIAPDVLLFDEPTTGLDPISSESIHRLIVRLSRQLQVTCIVVSHDMKSAFHFADRILVLDQGKLIADGSPEKVRAQGNPLIEEFLK